jgi:periplasmic protein TonB
MPQEFLRDVLRTGDGAERRHRRLSILPLSIAGHAVVLGAFLVSPWAGAIDLPVIASPFQGHYMETVPPPAPPAPSTPAQPAPRPLAPIEAPSEIGEEAPVAPRQIIDGALADGPNVSTGVGVLTDLSTGPPVTPLPPPPPEPTPRLVKVGGKIREPRKLVHVPPIYPELARQTRVQGAVTLEAILDATGKVESVRVLESVPLLDDAAVRAVRQWRYTPTELNGVPVPVLMTVTIRFSLDR